MTKVEATVGVPASPAGLTPDWLTRALVSGGLDVRVTDLDVTPIGVGFGVMSLVFRLTPTYEGPTGPMTLVAKIAPPYEQVRQIAAGYGFYACGVKRLQSRCHHHESVASSWRSFVISYLGWARQRKADGIASGVYGFWTTRSPVETGLSPRPA
jgi:hypothetical protein